MSLSIICVKQILIMFILVALGFLCGKINLIDKETNSKLSGFVLEVVNPVLIFMSYQQSFNNELLIGLGMSLVLGFISYGVMIFLLKFLYRKNKTNEGIVEQFAAIYSNCAFMGIPLINGLFGEEGVFFLTGYVTVFNIMVWTHGVVFFGGKEAQTSVKKVLTSPAIIATFLRLILCPVLFWLMFRWFDFIPDTVFMVVLVAAGCPAAATGTMFALRYKKCPEISAVVFAVTTLLSAITLPLMVMLGGV